VVSTDLEGNITSWNKGAERLFGYKEAEAIDRNISFVYPEGEQIFLIEQIIKPLQQKGSHETEVHMLHKSGKDIYAHLSLSMLIDNQGKASGMIGYALDITDRKKIEKALQESEARLNHLLTSSPVVIYSCKATENFPATYCSENLRDIFNLDPDEFIRIENYWADHIHPDDKQRVFTDLQDIFKHDYYEHEYRFRMRDGSYRWIFDGLRLIRDAEEQPLEIIGYWQDITEQKEIQDNLRDSEGRFRTLVENATDGIFVHDFNGNFIDVNQQACKSLGYSKHELLGMKVSDIDVVAKVEQLTWAELEQGKVLTVEGMHIRKDGSTFPVEVNISQITKDNKPCILALARDISQRKQTEGQLKEVNRELEAFAYSVSHDLRAPLRSINGFCNILLDEYSHAMDEDALMYMQRIVGASNKMSQLIDDLLQLSRVSRKELKTEHFNLSTMFSGSFKNLQTSEPGRKVEINVQPNLVIKGDKGLFNIVVNNLVSNAWKYSSKRKHAIIEFKASYQDGKQVFSICDNGAGFNMDYINKLFQPFQRLHPEKDFEGDGIGLATVQRIIHRHGGKIWAESEEGKGACFFFTL